MLNYKKKRIVSTRYLENVGICVENLSTFLNAIALYSPAWTLSFEAVKGYFELGSELNSKNSRQKNGL